MRHQIPIKMAYVGGDDLSLRLPIIKLLRSSGYDVCGVGPSAKEKELFRINDVPYEIYPLKRSFGLFSEILSFMRLYQVFKKNRYTIVHAFDTKPTILARIAARFAGVPLIIGTIPGMGSIFSEDNRTNNILAKVYRLGQKAACGVSDITIFQNTDDMAFFTVNKMVHSSKAALIKGSGVDVNAFSPEIIRDTDLRQLEAELGSRRHEIKVFMISRLLRYKGIQEYLEASRIVRERRNDVAFYLAGPEDKSMYSFPLEKVNEYKDTVKYLGPRNDIPQILRLADIVVLPTYYREGIPRILLEAACFEKPIVTTDVPGCREVVEDGINGYLVPPKNPYSLADALDKLISDEESRKSMGRKSREKVMREFSLDLVYKESLKLYQNLLSHTNN